MSASKYAVQLQECFYVKPLKFNLEGAFQGILFTKALFT